MLRHGFDSWRTPSACRQAWGTPQVENHGCTTLLQLVTWLNNRGHFQVSQENTTHGTHFFKWSDTTTTMVLFFARRQALMNTKWFRLWVYPKLFQPSLGYTKSRNHFGKLLWSPACLNHFMGSCRIPWPSPPTCVLVWSCVHHYHHYSLHHHRHYYLYYLLSTAMTQSATTTTNTTTTANCCFSQNYYYYQHNYHYF